MDETFDFVVVGSGGGSMCAGLVMRDAGKSVVILEKTDLVGGTTSRSGGAMWIPNNPFMHRAGVEDSYDKAMTYLDNVVGEHNDTPGATRERRHTYVVEGPRMVDFLVSKGVKLTRATYWPDYYDDLPGGSKQSRSVVAKLFNANELGPWKKKLRPGRFAKLPAYHDELFKLPGIKKSFRVKLLALRVGMRGVTARMLGRHIVAAGMALQGRMLQAAVKAGIDIRTETPVGKLLVEDGRVTGVETVRDGKPWRIGGRLGVLVNAGGFARNQRMRDKYIPKTSVEWTMAGPGDTGEMIEEMMSQGAAVAQMEEMVGHQLTLSPGAEAEEWKPSAQKLTASPHAILVDQTGVRYMNEGGSYMAYCRGMLERDSTAPAVPSWAVFDHECISNYMLGNTLPGANKPASWRETGYLKSADTIEKLADMIEVPPTALRTTVDRFNGFVDKNLDEDFARGVRAYDNWLGDWFHNPSNTLGRIERAPFHAVPVVPGDVSTYGGVVTDVHARVLREDGLPIPGLYATGVSTASVMGRTYPGAGASVGPSFVWGYVAAKHAAGIEEPR